MKRRTADILWGLAVAVLVFLVCLAFFALGGGAVPDEAFPAGPRGPLPR